MLNEESTTVKIKFNLKKNITMLLSFFVLCMFIYVFHIVQAAVFYRTYLTAFALLILGLGIKLTKHYNNKILWECNFIWFVYSLVFFDIRTHIQKHQFIIIILFTMFPTFSYYNLYRKGYGIYCRILFCTFVACTPTLFALVYGNALYSIIKLLSMVLLIITSQEENSYIENFIWPAFAHPVLLLLVPLQVVSNVLRLLRPKPQQNMVIQEVVKKDNTDIIGSADVPFLFRRNGNGSV